MNDSEGIEALLGGVLEDQDALYVVVYDAEGGVLASKTSQRYPQKGFTKLQDKSDATMIERGDDDVDTARTPITPMLEDAAEKDKPEILGFVRLGFSRAGLNERLRTLTLTNLIVVIIALVVAALALNRVITRLVEPLGAMATTAQNIAAGKLNATVRQDSQGEIGILARVRGDGEQLEAHDLRDPRGGPAHARDFRRDSRADR